MDPGLHVVVGAVLVHDGRALLVHRAPGRRWYPDVWDLPGGHVEPGETAADALARELHEELAVRATVDGEPMARVVAADFTMDVWVIDHVGATVRNVDPTEHDAIAWFAADELNGVALAHPSVGDLVGRALRRC